MKKPDAESPKPDPEETPDPEPLDRLGAAKRNVVAAVKEELSQHPYDADNGTFNIVQRLSAGHPRAWPGIREQLAFGAIGSIYRMEAERKRKADARTDERQGLLALPEWNLVSPLVKLGDRPPQPLSKVTVEQHRDSVKEHAALIKKRSYPYWSVERMAREKAALAQERKLDRKVIPLTGGNLEMDMGTAMELLQIRLASPVVQKGKKAIKARWDRKKGRTQNQ